MKSTQAHTPGPPISHGSSGQNTQHVNVTIEILGAVDLPAVGMFRPTQRKHYVVITIDGEEAHSQSTRKAQGLHPEWKQAFSYNVRPDARITLDVFADRTFQDVRIGTVTESISSLTDGTCDRKISASMGASLRFAVRKAVDDEKAAVHEMLDFTSSDLKLLQTPQPVALMPSAVEGGQAVVDTVQSVVGDWQPLLDKLQIFCEVMDGVSEVHPYATMAWTVLSAAYKVFKQQLDRDDKIRTLYQSMDALYMLVYELKKNMDDNNVDIQRDVVLQIAKQTTECCYFIRSYASDGDFVKRMAKNAFSTADDRIQEYCDTFDKLGEAFDKKLQVETRIVVTKVLSTVEGLSAKVDLSDMLYAEGAALCPPVTDDSESELAEDSAPMEKMCFPGTRVEVLHEIEEWVNSDASEASRVLLLTGAAGTGKSAIAHTIAYRFAALGRLGASFGFNRNQKKRTPEKLVPTLAQDLADFDANIYRGLCNVIERNKALRTTTRIETQFSNFIVKPLKDLSIIGPIVLVIDALDECADSSDASRKELLSLLARRLDDLPPFIRVLITSRPDHDIVSQLSGGHIHTMSMHNIDPDSTTDDIRFYVRDRLLDHPPIPLQDIDETCCEKLAASSQGLFQWAFVACDTIISAELAGPGMTPRERYEQLVESSSGRDQANVLDSLYSKVLSHLFPEEGPSLVRYRAIMELVLAAFEPLPLDALNSVLHYTGDTFDAGTILRYLGALLSGVTTTDEPIRPLHTSFRDYLTDKERSGIFFIDAAAGHNDFAIGCLHVLVDGLKFNICEFESSYVPNARVTDLQERIQRCISPQVSYAARFWPSHLTTCGVTRLDDSYNALIKRLLVEKFLFWLEVLSLLDSVPVAAPALGYLAQHLPTLYLHPGCSIADCAKDGRKFVETFGMAITQSAPHIYLSGLPFSPTTSIIRQYYLPLFKNMLTVPNPYTNWPTAQSVLYPLECTRSISVAPDGKSVASVGENGSIWMWDVVAGKPLPRALEGHNTDRTVNVAVFTVDGKFLCTGSDDETARVWDLETDQSVDKQFPEDNVLTIVAHPKNPQLVASGLLSGAIVVWNINTKEDVIRWTHGSVPLWTFGSRVVALAWSPDGKLLASGGEDGIIRLWDAVTGAPHGSPLVGHSDVISSLAFSPDGNQLASGSFDKSIRIWSVITCKAIDEPLVDHEVGRTQPVYSVAFSPDGRFVASASGTLVCLWSLPHGLSNTCQVLPGHTGVICSIAYSHDGTHIISGGVDGTVRVWDTEVGFPTRWITRHSGVVRSVAFTPDDKGVISSSNDTTLMLWDTLSGSRTGIILGHKKEVESVAISPDNKYIASSSWGGMLHIHDASSHELLFQIADHTNIDQVGFLPNGLLFSASDSKIMLWRPETGQLAEHQLEEPEEEIYYHSVTFSQTGRHIVSGCPSFIVVWDIETGKLIKRLEHGEDGTLRLALSAEGKHLLSMTQDSALIWDVETGEHGKEHDGDYCAEMWCAAISADGLQVASAGSDGLMYLWDAITGEVLCSLYCNAGTIWSLAFSHCGKRLVTGGEDGKIQLWDLDGVDDTGDVLFSRDPSHRLRDVESLAIEHPLKPLRHVDLYWDGWAKVVPEEPEETSTEADEDATSESSHEGDSQVSPQGVDGQDAPVTDNIEGEKAEREDAQTHGREQKDDDENTGSKSEIQDAGATDRSSLNGARDDEGGDGDDVEAADTEEDGGDAGSTGENQDGDQGEEGGDEAEDGEEEAEDNSRYLFWVPVEQRDTMVIPLRKVVLGSDPSDIDLSSFVHGANWANCYSPYAPQ